MKTKAELEKDYVDSYKEPPIVFTILNVYAVIASIFVAFVLPSMLNCLWLYVITMPAWFTGYGMWLWKILD